MDTDRLYITWKWNLSKDNSFNYIILHEAVSIFSKNTKVWKKRESLKSLRSVGLNPETLH